MEAEPRTINLFMIPFAGGNSYVYRNMKEAAAPFLNVILVDLPGHGRRIREKVLTDLDLICDDLFNHPELKGPEIAPYAIFGHSMGAALAYLLAKRMDEERNTPPVHMFFSGRQAPTVPSVEKDLHKLPMNVFIEKVMSYGGIPLEVAREKDLMDLFIPIMMADFKAIETYEFNDVKPVSAPASVFIGENDLLTPYETAFHWQEVSDNPIDITTFSGGHFFIFKHGAKIIDIINNSLAKVHLSLDAFVN